MLRVYCMCVCVCCMLCMLFVACMCVYVVCFVSCVCMCVCVCAFMYVVCGPHVSQTKHPTHHLPPTHPHIYKPFPHTQGKPVHVAMVNCIIAACSQLGDLARAWETYEAMGDLHVEPNIDTYNALAAGCVQHGRADAVDEVWWSCVCVGLCVFCEWGW